MLVAGYLLWRYWQRTKLSRLALQAYKDGLEARLSHALASTDQMAHAAVLLPADDFVALGRLCGHEELLGAGLLRFHHRLNDLLAAPVRGCHPPNTTHHSICLPGCSDRLTHLTQDKIIFFSHQWTSFTEPDPTGRQYAAMAAAIGEVRRHNGWSQKRVMIWCDYFSIPQKCRGSQALAISSLTAFASYAHAFVIVAPHVTHEDTSLLCSLESYNRRMWCRAENLCYSLHNGVTNMWVAMGTEGGAEGDGSGCARLQEHGEEFMASNLRVMQGEATVEADKRALVLPILGLYASHPRTFCLSYGFAHTPTPAAPGRPRAVPALDTHLLLTWQVRRAVRLSPRPARDGRRGAQAERGPQSGACPDLNGAHDRAHRAHDRAQGAGHGERGLS